MDGTPVGLKLFELPFKIVLIYESELIRLIISTENL